MRYIFFLFLITFLIFIGCEPDDIQKTFQPKFAVYCILKADKIANARIEFTQDIKDTNTYWIGSYNERTVNPDLIYSSAKVALFENELFVDSLRFNPTTYLYEGDNHKVQSGGKYRLEIKANDQPVISGSTTVPFPVKIVGLDTAVTLYNEFNNTPVLHVTLLFSDPLNENNFYELFGERRFKNDSQICHNPISFSLNGIFENLWSYSTSPVYFSDKLFNGETISLKLVESGNEQGFLINPSDSFICFNLSNVSEEEARYHRSVDRYWYCYNNGSAFSEPVSMFGNIINAAGIFAGMAESFDTIKLYK
jgi:hypothetical protein